MAKGSKKSKSVKRNIKTPRPKKPVVKKEWKLEVPTEEYFVEEVIEVVQTPKVTVVEKVVVVEEAVQSVEEIRKNDIHRKISVDSVVKHAKISAKGADKAIAELREKETELNTLLDEIKKMPTSPEKKEKYKERDALKRKIVLLTSKAEALENASDEYQQILSKYFDDEKNYRKGERLNPEAKEYSDDEIDEFIDMMNAKGRATSSSLDPKRIVKHEEGKVIQNAVEGKQTVTKVVTEEIVEEVAPVVEKKVIKKKKSPIVILGLENVGKEPEKKVVKKDTPQPKKKEKKGFFSKFKK